MFCVPLALMSLPFLRLFVSQLRREKIDLENTLEQEQEALVNRLWKRMDKLEAEKRLVMIQKCCVNDFPRRVLVVWLTS